MEKEIVYTYLVAGVVIEKDGRYLLVQEMKPSVYGLWNLPAGKVDVGETIEQAATREAKEETGYDVEIIRKIAVIQNLATEAVKHLFEVRIVGGDLAYPKDEILDARWFTLEEIQNMKEKLRNSWVLDGALAAEKGLKKNSI